MKENYCRKTKYLNHYSLRLLIGSLCLTLPTLSAIILLIVWESFDFIWVPILFGILGWFLILPSTYALVHPSKERLAVDALSMGFVAMLCLCSVVISSKWPALIQILDSKTPQTIGERAEQLGLKERGIPPEYLEQLHLRMEELSLASQEEKLQEEDNP
ncbi:MAG: hypothetical protein JNJ47_01260 [Alphaproteobacteria bacterium]|nr:hypothetical protein [Alphaproteobacteria bacterium]